MLKLVTLAWRNIWRNQRRTLITISSIFFAVLLALFMRSMQFGSYENMIRNSVEFYSGYIQIHKKGYWENKSINKLLEETDSVKALVNTTQNVHFYIPRLESFVLAASDNLSKGAMVIGTGPEEENQMTRLASKVIEGEYFTSGTRGVLIAQGLAEYLQLHLHDTLVLIGQGYHGVNAVDMYPITGIIKLPNPQANNNMVYMPIVLAQEFNAAPDLLSAMVIKVNDIQSVQQTTSQLQNTLGDSYEVMDWKSLQPELVQLIESDNAGGVIMLGILYVVIAFGIFGTVIMMSMERTKEFGILIAVGMQKLQLSFMIVLETIFIGLFGLGVSLTAGIPLLLYMHKNPIPLTGNAAEAMLKMGVEPIVPFSLEPNIFITQCLAILVIVVICLVYPVWNIYQLKIIETMKR
ncbi:FtsX-like permease family protein [Rapidithrix thailandica]|uniref:FtsX-like permease family protein n=1 Tax=Rapidithrix thailandica TaxID=413964 RepID=A0AAW9S7L3_9BACT